MTAMLRYIDALEIRVCLRVNGYGRPERFRRFFAAVSRLGDGWGWLVLGVAALALHGTAALPVILRALAAAAIGLAVYRLLKQRLVRERPFVASDEIRCLTPPLDRYSFPSGHTLHAVCFTSIFGNFEPLLLIAAAPFALLVAISRVVLGLHYPSDVLAGAALGAALAAAAAAL